MLLYSLNQKWMVQSRSHIPVCVGVLRDNTDEHCQRKHSMSPTTWACLSFCIHYKSVSRRWPISKHIPWILSHKHQSIFQMSLWLSSLHELSKLGGPALNSWFNSLPPIFLIQYTWMDWISDTFDLCMIILFYVQFMFNVIQRKPLEMKHLVFKGTSQKKNIQTDKNSPSHRNNPYPPHTNHSLLDNKQLQLGSFIFK